MKANLTDLEAKVMAELINCVESGDEWGCTNIDNAMHHLSDTVTRKSFAGVLGSLTVKGLYRPEGDDIWGYVLTV